MHFDFADPTINHSAVEAAQATAWLFKAQPPCTSCGEQGYLRYDFDSDQYLLCDLCGAQQ